MRITRNGQPSSAIFDWVTSEETIRLTIELSGLLAINPLCGRAVLVDVCLNVFTDCVNYGWFDYFKPVSEVAPVAAGNVDSQYVLCGHGMIILKY